MECEAIDVGLMGRMVERAAENEKPPAQGTVIAAAGRFARDAGEFAVDSGGEQ